MAVRMYILLEAGEIAVPDAILESHDNPNGHGAPTDAECSEVVRDAAAEVLGIQSGLLSVYSMKQIVGQKDANNSSSTQSSTIRSPRQRHAEGGGVEGGGGASAPIAVRVASPKLTLPYYHHLLATQAAMQTKVEKLGEALDSCLVQIQTLSRNSLSPRPSPPPSPPPVLVRDNRDRGAERMGHPRDKREKHVTMVWGPTSESPYPRTLSGESDALQTAVQNAQLQNEVESLRARLVQSERFKTEVLHTVTNLKSQVSLLMDEAAMNNWRMEG